VWPVNYFENSWSR